MSLFDNCCGKYAIAAVNVGSPAQNHALFRAAQKAEAPFIVQMTTVTSTFTFFLERYMESYNL